VRGRNGKFRSYVDMLAKVTRKEGILSKYKAAYILNRDPTAVVRYMKALAEIFPEEFTYKDGELIHKSIENELQRSDEDG